jgi:hypothetical protein
MTFTTQLSTGIVSIIATDWSAAGCVRPSGNITGFATFEATLGGKWLELRGPRLVDRRVLPIDSRGYHPAVRNGSVQRTH